MAPEKHLTIQVLPDIKRNWGNTSICTFQKTPPISQKKDQTRSFILSEVLGSCEGLGGVLEIQGMLGGSTATVLVSSRHSVHRVGGKAHLLLIYYFPFRAFIAYQQLSFRFLEVLGKKKKREIEGTEILE